MRKIIRKNLQVAAHHSLILLALMAFMFLAEPVLRHSFTYAITNLNGRSTTVAPAADLVVASKPTETVAPQKTRLPEPNTLFLFLSGLTGIIIRFAQRSFARFKRISDLVLSVIGLTIVMPVMLFLALLIKLTSPGPVIYRQRRVGKGGKIFEIYKFRSMRADAEKLTGAVWAQANDPRVTAIGRVMRKTHLDEIPQFINVLKGEMSIVGPRPERPEMVRDLKVVIQDYEKRLAVQPGITGLAQVYHKYDETIEDVKKKVKYDCMYIKNMCWQIEMRILAMTFVVSLTGKGAR